MRLTLVVRGELGQRQERSIGHRVQERTLALILLCTFQISVAEALLASTSYAPPAQPFSE